MKSALSILAAMLVAASVATAATPKAPQKFNFQNAEITQLIAAYSKAAGQKFVVDPSVRGKITIHVPASKEPSLEEAFALLSSALALNGFAISEQGDTMVVTSARNTQRSLVPTVTALPPLKPERMVTMIFKLKHYSGDEVNKRLRILPSKEGELTPFADRVVITDWVSNLHRIAAIIAELDKPGTLEPPPSAKKGEAKAE